MIHKLHLSSSLTLSYVGPRVEEGPLPALLYLALSAEESLEIDPYNQVVTSLAPFPLRIFSLDLPAHGPGLSSEDALNEWAKRIAQGENLIENFTQILAEGLRSLLEKGILVPDKLAIMGLSRGAFLACHLAALLPEIKTILGFAPVTDLRVAKEFSSIPPQLSFTLINLADALYNRTIRFYIGNRDLRVGTENCFLFIKTLADVAYANKIRSAPIELFINPSIGFQGHGTSKKVFEEGATWIAKQLELAHE